MKIPNSRFAEMVRSAKAKARAENSGFNPMPDPGMATALTLAPFQSVTDSFEQV